MTQLSTRHAWAMMNRLTAFTVSVESSTSLPPVVRLYAKQKGWLPGNPLPVRLPGVTVLATRVSLWRRCGRRQNSSAESRLSQDEERTYAKELSVEAE